MRKPRRKREPITMWAGLHDAVTTGEIRSLWDSIKTEYSHRSNRWRLTGLRRRGLVDFSLARKDDHA